MNDIDFLPVHYRHRRARRQYNPWRAVAVAVVCAVLGVVAAVDYRRYAVEKERFDAIVPRYEAAVGLMTQLTALQAEYKKAEANAELYVYLRHPWPRTQIVAALLANIPEEITLDQLEIVRAAPSSPSGNRGLAREVSEAQQKELALLPPAARDLRRLREELDPMRTVVTLSGETRDSAPLYRYLAEIDRADLFAKADLDALESSPQAQSRNLRFRATILVTPGYGQPGGPVMFQQSQIRGTAQWAR